MYIYIYVSLVYYCNRCCHLTTIFRGLSQWKTMENLVGMDNNDAAIRFHTTADIHLMMLDDVLWCWPTTSSKYFDMNYFDFSSIYHDISTKEKRTPIEIYLNMWCVWKWGTYMVFTSICPKFQWQFHRVSSEKSWKNYNIKFRRSDLHRAAWGHTNATHEVHPDSQGCVKDIVGKYILLDVYVAHRWDIVRRLFWDTKKTWHDFGSVSEHPKNLQPTTTHQAATAKMFVRKIMENLGPWDLGAFLVKATKKVHVLQPPTGRFNGCSSGPWLSSTALAVQSFEAAGVSPSAHHLKETTRECPSDLLRSSRRPGAWIAFRRLEV